ncbi:hypothetical protein ACHAWF_002215 [Thalassiosira exigua]
MYEAIVVYTRSMDYDKNGPKAWKKAYLGEKSYRAFIDDLMSNETEWIRFFAHKENSIALMMSLRVITTLASIVTKRGDLENGGEILEIHDKCLTIYRDGCQAENKPNEWHLSLLYDANMARFDLFLKLERHDDNVGVWKELCLHEIKFLPADQHASTNLPMMKTLSEKEGAITVRDIVYFDPDGAVRYFQLIANSDSYKSFCNKEAKRTRLLNCGNCDKEETSLHQFSICTRCKKEAYCSPMCQKAHWKVHKKQCTV